MTADANTIPRHRLLAAQRRRNDSARALEEMIFIPVRRKGAGRRQEPREREDFSPAASSSIHISPHVESRHVTLPTSAFDGEDMRYFEATTLFRGRLMRSHRAGREYGRLPNAMGAHYAIGVDAAAGR